MVAVRYRFASRWRDEPGFTLVEAVVALFVLAIIFTALAYAATGALRASLNSRAEQQAIDFATEAMETARQQDYYSLANQSTVSGGAVVSCGSDKCIDPGTGSLEKLITSSTGTAQTEVPVDSALGNRVNFQVSTYVTDPDDARGDYKRITAVTTWTIGGKARSRSMTSLVTATNRGLPIPVFKLTPIGGTAQAVNPGSVAEFHLEISNQGAPDHWNLQTSPADTWLFYADNGDGVLCLNPADPALTGLVIRECDGLAGTDFQYDIAMADSTADGMVDTGRIDPTATKDFWALRPISADTAVGDYWTTLTASSVAVSGGESGTSALDLLVQVVTGTVTNSPEPPPAVTEAPGPPQNLTVTPGVGSLALSWSAPISPGSSAITDYVVRYKVTGTATWSVWNDGMSTATTATITGLADETDYDVQVNAENAVGEGDVGVVGTGRPQYLLAYSPPARCAATSPPVATAASGYTLRAYTLHNRSANNPAWPGTDWPVTGPPSSSTVLQGIPLVMAVDSPQFPQATNLPIYSSNIVDDRRGRVVMSGGTFTTTDTTKVVDWRATTTGKQYSGNAVLRIWMKAVDSSDTILKGYNLQVQLYKQTTAQTSPQDDKLAGVQKSAPVTITAPLFTCSGWQELVVSLPVLTTKALAANESLGVRLWNLGGANMVNRVRIAYDVAGDTAEYPNFPAALTLPEK